MTVLNRSWRRSWPVRVALTGLAVAALACGGGGLFGPPEPTLPAPQQWRVDVTTSLITQPVLTDGMLIYQGISSDLAQDVFGRDAATGELRWTYDLSSYPTTAAPLWVDNGLVFVIQSAAEGDSLGVGRLLALDTHSGVARWDLALGETWQDSLSSFFPAAADGRVFVETGYGSGQHHLTALDSANGDPLWEYPLTGTLTMQPTLLDGRLVAAESHFAEGAELATIFALDAATGAPAWSFDLSGNVLLNRFAAGDGRLYYATFDGTVVALEAASGLQLWAVPFEGTTPNDPHEDPTFFAGQVFFSAGDGVLYALDAATGAENWHAATGSAPSGSPAAGSGLVFASSIDGYLYAYDTLTGDLKWQVRNDLRKAFPDLEYYPPIDTPPLVANDVAYFILSGRLVALEVAPQP